MTTIAVKATCNRCHADLEVRGGVRVNGAYLFVVKAHTCSEKQVIAATVRRDAGKG